MVNPAAIGKGLKTTAEIISAATTVIGAAGALKDAAQPVMDADEGRVVIEKAKGALGGLAKKASAAKDTIGEKAGKMADAKDSRAEAKQLKREERELAKHLKAARQAVLERASQAVTFKQFAKCREDLNSDVVALAAGPFEGPGCFVIATYSLLDLDNDLTDYLYIHVGKGEKLGRAIELASSREGDPDVYADVKYKQNVRIYAYPCAVTDIDEKYEALVSLFLADECETE